MMCDGISQHDLEQNTIASLPPSIHALLLAQVGKLVQEQVDETRLEVVPEEAMLFEDESSSDGSDSGLESLLGPLGL